MQRRLFWANPSQALLPVVDTLIEHEAMPSERNFFEKRRLRLAVTFALAASLAGYLLWAYVPWTRTNNPVAAAGAPAPAENTAAQLGVDAVASTIVRTDVVKNERSEDQALVDASMPTSSDARREELAPLTLDALRAKAQSGNIDAMIDLARRLADTDPSDETFGEAIRWLDEGVILGSTEAAMVQGEICLKACFPADPLDPGDYNNWRIAAQYYLLAYLMGDARALKALEAITPPEMGSVDVYNVLGLARMRLEEVIARRAQQGLGPLQMELNATSPYLKPNPPPRGGEYLLPGPPPGG